MGFDPNFVDSDDNNNNLPKGVQLADSLWDPLQHSSPGHASPDIPQPVMEHSMSMVLELGHLCPVQDCSQPILMPGLSLGLTKTFSELHHHPSLFPSFPLMSFLKCCSLKAFLAHSSSLSLLSSRGISLPPLGIRFLEDSNCHQSSKA